MTIHTPNHRFAQITERPLSELRTRARNSRTHSSRQIKQIADSIQRFGFVNPIITDDDGMIIAGHGRFAAAQYLKLAAVPTISIKHLGKDELRAYAIADNRLAELAGWDKNLLAIEMAELVKLDVDLDLTITGFAQPQIDILIQSVEPNASDSNEVPPPKAGDAVTRPGDLWILGNHRIVCGDLRDPNTLERLLDGEKVRLIVTDPPYNVPVTGHVLRSNKAGHTNFAMASGEMTPAEFTSFLATSMANMVKHAINGGLLYVFMDWRHMRELLEAGERNFPSGLLNLCIWTKTNAGMGSFYRSQHELVFVFKHGTDPHVNNVELGRYGRNRSNVWTYQSVNSGRRDRAEALAAHPTPKPIELIQDIIQDASHRGDIILDGFGGAGSTLLAAERTGRRARLVEIEPRFVDATIQRWQRATGKMALHSGTQQTFQDVKTERGRLHPDPGVDT